MLRVPMTTRKRHRRIMSDKAGAGERSFWAHADVLRSTLRRSLALLALCAIACGVALPYFFDTLILGPCSPDFPTYTLLGVSDLSDIRLVNLELTAQFMLHFSIAVWLGLIVALPGILWQLWQFVVPALYPVERRVASRALVGSAVMFYLGVTLAYFILFPVSLRFLFDYHLSPDVANTISLNSYVSTLTWLSVGMGLLFQMPVVAWGLGLVGVIDRSFFSRYRRHAIVAMLTLSAVVTPTTDPFSLMLLFVPLYLLWEGAAFIVPRRNAAEKPGVAEQ